MKSRVEIPGMPLGQEVGKSQKECEDICDNNEKCKSFTYVPALQKCFLKNKQLTGNEPQQKYRGAYTVYKSGYCQGHTVTGEKAKFGYQNEYSGPGKNYGYVM